jgi:hypothetical protein
MARRIGRRGKYRRAMTWKDYGQTFRQRLWIELKKFLSSGWQRLLTFYHTIFHASCKSLLCHIPVYYCSITSPIPNLFMAQTECPSGPFEGPEKLLELWFAPSAAHVQGVQSRSKDGRFGLRKVKREVWEEMLDIVKCKILSIIEGSEMDAYLLRYYL